MITLLKAFRLDENTVKALYFHNEFKYEFLIEWNNVHPETGEVENYDLQLDCLSSNDVFSDRVIESIRNGESEDNKDIDLYLAIRDTFDLLDCECLDDTV